MTAELPQEVSQRLESDRYAWLTTVTHSGQPVPRLVGFVFDGTELIVYSMPDAAKVKHIKANPRVSLNLDSDGSGYGVVAVGGKARVDAVDASHSTTSDIGPSTASTRMGVTEEFLSAFNTRLRISIDRVWSAPPND
jgi:PPOX class probable F420-dependent enzyme